MDQWYSDKAQQLQVSYSSESDEFQFNVDAEKSQEECHYTYLICNSGNLEIHLSINNLPIQNLFKCSCT